MLTEDQREEFRQEFRDDLKGLFNLALWIVIIVSVAGFIFGVCQ